MSAQPNFEREKSKLNRVRSRAKTQWTEAKMQTRKQARNLSTQATSKTQDFVQEIKDKATSFLKKTAKVYSLDRALKLVKTHPLQAAIGGAALGLVATAHFLGKRK